MKPNRRVFILGGAHTPFIGKHHPDFIWKRHPDFGVRENPTLDEHLKAAIEAALEDAGVEAAQIQKGHVGNFAGELFSNQGHLGSLVSRVVPELEGTPFTRVEAACASGALAVVACIESIQAGYDITLAAGAEVQTTVSAREGAGFLARAAHFATESSLDDFTFPAMFARRAMHYKDATGATDEEIAHVVVKAYANGNINPHAHMKTVKMTIDNAANASDKNPRFLRNEELHPHLKISDCSQVSDGGAAMVIVSEDGLRALGKKPEDAVEILSYGHANGALGKVKDFTRLEVTARAAREAYDSAGLTADDMQVAEVHDCFSIAEVQMTEALGFAEYGQGAAFAKEGRTSLTGDKPINTGGGLLAFGHPVGATGVKQFVEVARQLTGKAGEYQLAEKPEFGITANMGGDDRTGVCAILRAPEAN